MKVKPVYFFIFIFLFFSSLTTLRAQLREDQKLEVGLWAGTATYFGDIRPAPLEAYRLIQPAVGGYFRINLDDRISIKTGFNYGRLVAEDAWTANSYERLRNLSFFSDIYDFSLMAEFNFYRFVLKNDKFNFSPYLSAGVAVFHFNPKAEAANGEVYELQPLGTEGQNYPQFSGNEPYSLWSWAIPIGGGVKYNLSSNFSIGIDIGYRFTFTDYLDDISGTYVDRAIIGAGANGPIALTMHDRSAELGNEPIGIAGKQRGNSKNSDAYLLTGITISYTFTTYKCPTPTGIF